MLTGNHNFIGSSILSSFLQSSIEILILQKFIGNKIVIAHCLVAYLKIVGFYLNSSNVFIFDLRQVGALHPLFQLFGKDKATSASIN